MLFYFILITMYSTLFLAFCGNVIIILCSNFKKSKNSAVTNIEQAGFQKMKFTYGPTKCFKKFHHRIAGCFSLDFISSHCLLHAHFGTGCR